jgi:hypothetical protein
VLIVKVGIGVILRAIGNEFEVTQKSALVLLAISIVSTITGKLPVIVDTILIAKSTNAD